jgi:hypothetical protein
MKATAPEVIKQAPAGCIQAVAPVANSARRMWGIVRLAAIKTSTGLGTEMGLPEGCGRKDQLLDADGSAMVVHAAADNDANSPVRYHSHDADVFGPDPTTLSAGIPVTGLPGEDQAVALS